MVDGAKDYQTDPGSLSVLAPCGIATWIGWLVCTMTRRGVAPAAFDVSDLRH
jgi:hypothetical protein